MGISGLLPLLKSIHKTTTLKKFAGQTIGIDGHGWLHRGAVACALELALDKPTTKYVDFAMSRVRMLLDFGITPYIVFDGDNLPSKAGTNEERRKKRNEAKVLGLSLYKAGKVSQAHQELQKATGVTPYMARLFIEELKKLNVQYVVAPYEADAQLAYLERKGIINGILSEDSDLLVFGAKRLITKLNQYGECVEIERADFPLCKEVSLAGWTDAMFRRMAILSGCDYLQNIEKMGLKTAYRFVRKYKDADKAIRMIAFEGKFSVPQGYLEGFKQAELTFLHHRVFCPIQQRMVFLTELERGMSEQDMPYLGPYVEPDIAIGVACGDLNPRTKEPIEVKTAVSMRPPLRENRRQTFATPSDLKQKGSLDSFFKAQRTPLQELDPNSLTPSPSQQRLLERHRNASWEPRTVNSAPQLRRAATSIHVSNASIERSSFLARAATMSNYQPPKRQRLCSEHEDISPSKEIKRSPFFSSNTSIMSPLGAKKLRSKKAKRDFDVWSDDSVDGILIELMAEDNDATIANVSNKKNDAGEDELYEETVEDIDTVPQSSPARSSGDSQGPQYSSNNTQTQTFPSQSTTNSQNTVIASVNADDDPDTFNDLLDYHVRQQNERIAQTFVAQSPSRRAAALESLSPPKKRVAVSPAGEEPDPFGHCSQQKEANLPIVTELESSESSRISSGTASAMLRTFLYQSSEAQASALRSLTKTQSDAEKIEVARASLAQNRRARASVQNSTSTNLRRDGAGLSAASSGENLRGSEDAIIPNSEDENSGEDDGGPKQSVKLEKFIFVG